MASISDFGYDGIGILQPALKNRWRLEFSNTDLDILRVQALSVEPINLMSNDDIIITYEMDVKGGVLKCLKDMVDSPATTDITIEALDGNNNVNFAMQYKHCRISQLWLGSENDGRSFNRPFNTDINGPQHITLNVSESCKHSSFDYALNATLRITASFEYSSYDVKFPHMRIT